MTIEARNWYVRDDGSRVAHHLDYSSPELDHALCGHPFNEILSQCAERPRAVCSNCQDLMDRHDATWWEQEAGRRADGLAALRDEKEKVETDLRSRLGAARAQVNRLGDQVAKLRAKALRDEAKLVAARAKLPPQSKRPSVVSGGLPSMGKRR